MELNIEDNHQPHDENDFTFQLIKVIQQRDIAKINETIYRLKNHSECSFYDVLNSFVRFECPLGVAAASGLFMIVQKLLSEGAELNFVTSFGSNVIHEACKSDNPELLDFLLKEVAQTTDRKIYDLVNLATDRHWAPLHYAAAYGCHLVTQKLIDYNAVIDQTDSSQSTALHIAARNGYVKVVEVLIRANASVNTLDHNNQTPLQNAASVGTLDCIKCLVEFGEADIHNKDNVNLSAFDLANEMGQTECALYLWEKGSVVESVRGRDRPALTWSRPCFRNKPSPRYNAQVISLRDKIYVIGGYGSSKRFLMDLYELDLNEEQVESLVDVRGDISMKKLREGYTFDPISSSPHVHFSEDLLTASLGKDSAADIGGTFSSEMFDPEIMDFGYCEITILDSGERNIVAIGLVDDNYPQDRHPGWEKFSYGYHGDDGKTFFCKGYGIPWGPMYSTGDIIGIGVNFENSEIFFTKNGNFIGVAFDDIKHIPYRVMVGLTAGTSVSINFGKKPFKFNFEVPLFHWDKIQCDGEIPPPARYQLFTRDNKEIVASPDNRSFYVLDVVNYTWRVEESRERVRSFTAQDLVTQIGDYVYTLRPLRREFYRLNLHDFSYEDLSCEDYANYMILDDEKPKFYSAAAGEELFTWKSSDTTIYIYHTVSKTWRSVVPAGLFPQFEQYSVTAVGSILFTFGGWDNRRQHNDVFAFDTEHLFWYQPHVRGIAIPRPRNNHATCVYDNKILHICGWDGRDFLSDIEVLDCDPLRSKTPQLFNFIFDNPQHSDFILSAEGNELFAHKIILASLSDYFREFLLTKNENHFQFPINVPFDFVYAMVYYVYTENLLLSRIGSASNFPIFLDLVKQYFPKYKDVLNEKLVLTRVQYDTQYSGLQWAYKNDAWTDLTLVAGDEEFKVHKAVASSRSSYFRGMLTSGMKESGQKVITLSDVNPRILEALLEYMYTDNLEFTDEVQDMIVDIFICANQFDVEGCFKMLEDVLCNNLELENVISLAILGDQMKAHKLVKCCRDFITSENHLDLIFGGEEYYTYKYQIDELFGEDFYQQAKEEIEMKKQQKRKKQELAQKTIEEPREQDYLQTFLQFLRDRGIDLGQLELDDIFDNEDDE
eukprot:TRINITY_DN1930_c0_g1_i1.p1 TRINITY_DN1930_c0_g1~~TRINITY_DN1930_c0_g1_i1.p1  ORF type:complete len:1123 (-),score=233.46 TRINITY_DN1930_c0_g1_i1:19-3357(-)